MHRLIVIFLVFSVAESRTRQTTTLELMSKYLETLELTASDKDNARSGKSSETSKQDHNDALVKQYYRECNDSQTTECTKRLKTILHLKIQHILEGKKNSPDLHRHLQSIKMCLDEVNLITYYPETGIRCYGNLTEAYGYEEFCKKGIFYSRKPLFCNDVKRSYKKTVLKACCGNVLYNISTDICYKGNVQHNLEGGACCGNQAYDKQKQICCFDRKVFNKTQGDSCCEDNVYNSTTHLCCETTVQPTYNGIKRKTDLCCGNVSFHSECWRCINHSQLSIILEDGLCCDGALKERKYGIYTACCLTEVINISKDICLKDDIHPKVKSTVHSDCIVTEDTVVEEEQLTTGYPTPTSYDKLMMSALLVNIVMFGVLLIEIKLLRTNVSHLTSKSTNVRKLDFSAESDTGQSLISDTWFKLKDFLKRHDWMKDNTLKCVKRNSRYFMCSSTQTNAEKVVNRNILGNTFDYTEHLSLNKSTLQMANSEVKMTLPFSVLRDGSVEVNASTFRCISELQEKLDISSDEKMASPAVEYVLTGFTNLKDFAVVVMPFVGEEEDLRVKKFRSDGGLKEVADILVVPRQGKTNEELDMYYIIKGSFVYIYTKSFSGFYCTTCRHTRGLKLHALVFGSFKRFLNPVRYEVRMAMYINDEILKFADYQERMFNNEANQGREIKLEKTLKLPKHLTENDTIQAFLKPTLTTDSHEWIPKPRPDDDKPIYDVNQRVNMSDVVEKCKDCQGCHLLQHEMPYSMEWYFTCPQGVCPSSTFQCIIYIKTTSDDGDVDDCIVIDELLLRQKDRYPIEENLHTRSIRGVQKQVELRPELSNSGNSSQSLEGPTLNTENDKRNILSSNERDSHRQDVNSKETINDFPIQEHAPLDETYVKG